MSIKCFLLGLLLLTTGQVFAEDSKEELAFYRIGIQSSRPCSSWRYSQGGYSCSFPGLTVYTPNGYDVQQAIIDLDRRVVSLEQEVKALREELEKKN